MGERPFRWADELIGSAAAIIAALLTFPAVQLLPDAWVARLAGRWGLRPVEVIVLIPTLALFVLLCLALHEILWFALHWLFPALARAPPDPTSGGRK